MSPEQARAVTGPGTVTLDLDPITIRALDLLVQAGLYGPPRAAGVQYLLRRSLDDLRRSQVF